MLGVGHELRPERAADVARDHADLLLGKPECPSHYVAHAERHLCRYPDADAAASIRLRHYGVALDGRGREALVHEPRSHDHVRADQRALVAKFQLERDAVALPGVDDYRKRLVVDDHRGSGIDRGLSRRSDGDGDEVAHEVDLVGAQAGSRGLGPELQICGDVDRLDAGNLARRGHVNSSEPSMRHRRAHEHRVEAVLRLYVVGVLSLAGHEAGVLAPLDPAPQRGAHRHPRKGSLLGMLMEVTCRCGWTTRGTKAQVIANIQAHGRSEHQTEVTPAEVRAIWRVAPNSPAKN